MRIVIEQDLLRRRDNMYIFDDEGNQITLTATIQRKSKDDATPINPSLSFSRKLFQLTEFKEALLNAFQEVGLMDRSHPMRSELEATKNHLNDMRMIVLNEKYIPIK